MANAGQILVAGRIPGERIATTLLTSDGAGATTTDDHLGASVTAQLVAGRTYRITMDGAMRTSVGGDIADLEIHEDALGGGTLQDRKFGIPATNTFGFPFHIEAEYTADTTGSKTFVFAYGRRNGSGTVRPAAGSSRPGYLYVDYIRG